MESEILNLGPTKLAKKKPKTLLNSNRKRVIQMLDLFNSKYDCKLCRKKLRTKADQIVHSELKHKPDSHANTINCPYCDLKHTTYFQLTSHLMINHLNERPYGCRLCKKKFHAFIQLKRHCNTAHLNTASLKPENSSNSSSSLCSSGFVSKSSSSSSSSSSSYCSSSSFNSTLTNKCQSLFDLIDYTNSNLCLDEPAQISDPKRAKSDDLAEILFDNSLNESVFTIITQFNIDECSLCSKLFKTNSDYLNHFWNAHIRRAKPSPNSKHDCWSCFQRDADSSMASFASQTELVKHLQTKHLNEMPYKCSVCSGAYFNDLSLVKAHFMQHHLDVMSKEEFKDVDDLASKYTFVFACSNCEQIYQTYDSILEHFIKNNVCNLNSQMANSKRHKCSKCSVLFSNQVTFGIHLDQHECARLNESGEENEEDGLGDEQNPIIVRKTPIFVKNKANVNMSSNNRQYTIDSIVNSASSHVNSNSSSKLDGITSKIKSLHEKKQDQPDLNSFQNSNLSSFMSAFSNSAFSIPISTSFLLNQPQTSSIDLAALQKYAQTYQNFQSKPSSAKASQPEQLKCELCSYGFRNVGELAQHKQLHVSQNGKQPFKCHLCLLTFAKTDKLVRHMIVHQANESDSVCQLCFSSFSRKQDLDRHMLFHYK